MYLNELPAMAGMQVAMKYSLLFIASHSSELCEDEGEQSCSPMDIQ